MLKKRDAQGLPIQIIILAVIGLIILVVIMAIFTKESGKATKAFGECEGRGGKCQDSRTTCSGPKIPNLCPDKSEVCCVPVET